MELDTNLLKDIIDWEVKSWGRAISLWNEVLPQQGNGLKALEIGARRGGLSLFLARRGYQVTCTDIDSPEPLARPIHDRHGVAARITYSAADATALPYADASFDVVAYKSVLGSLGRNHQSQLQRNAIAECHRVLRPGGYKLFAENLTSTRLHMAMRRKLNPWGRYYYYLQRSEIDSLMQQFDEVKYQTFGFTALLGRNEFQRNKLYYLDLVLDRLLPDSWKYLIYGYGRKK